VSISKDSFVTLDRDSDSVLYIMKTTGTDDSNPRSWNVRSLVSARELSHGLAVHKKFIYVSTPNNVFRWPYTNSGTSNFTIIGRRQRIMMNMNDDGRGGTTAENHVTQTLAFDPKDDKLYVSVGSKWNVDDDSFCSCICRFTIKPPYPIDYITGEVFADGIHNAVGLAFDANDTLWAVENGSDELFRRDLGGDISKDNPAEELHRFLPPYGHHYGYPYCITEYMMPNFGSHKGTVWAMLETIQRINNANCRANYSKAVLAMQGHSAPLGMTFYKYNSNRKPQCRDIVPFPASMNGYAFIAFHGSWNRDIPTGYKVVYVPIPIKGRERVDLL
jgi:glucose/arabinose dehydrogenase